MSGLDHDFGVSAKTVAGWAPVRNGSARVAVLSVFVILFVSYAFFWQRRDWNSASRLMLVYAMGDRGTIAIDGLERQTGDKAAFLGHHYSDKGPGYSLVALPVYLAARVLVGLPAHPLGGEALAYWPADYWVTLFTSGLVTAATGALITWFAIWLGCPPTWGFALGLMYGLATPAYVYATLAYGHATTSFCLFTAFVLLCVGSGWPRPGLAAFQAGLAAGLAGLIELSVAPVILILGLLILVGSIRKTWPVSAAAYFVLGGCGPLLILLGYNMLAYQSPLDMGYAHHTVPKFREVHSARNPLGLVAPRWDLAGTLLWSEYRGLLTYAPFLWLAPLGWLRFWNTGRAGLAAVSLGACAALFLVNLSYPEWTGGWCTGPRLLVPLLPFATIAVAGCLRRVEPPWLLRFLRVSAVVLGAVGGVVVLLCLGVGGRIPESLGKIAIARPIHDVAWPLWSGRPVPPWWIGDRFVRNLIERVWPGPFGAHGLAPGWQWLQFVPLVAVQAIGTGLAVWLIRRASRAASATTDSQAAG